MAPNYNQAEAGAPFDLHRNDYGFNKENADAQH